MGTRPKGEEPQKREPKPKRGPKPERLKLEVPWEEAVSKSLKKPPPPKKKGREK
jgi:hypothetical protein